MDILSKDFFLKLIILNVWVFFKVVITVLCMSLKSLLYDFETISNCVTESHHFSERVWGLSLVVF